MSYSSTEEKISFSISLKDCVEGFYYNITVLIEDSSSGYKESFSTEELKCLKNKTEIIFSKRIQFKFYFEKLQKINFKLIKKTKNTYDKLDRVTSLSNIISSPNSKYERILEKSKDKEILSVIVNKDTDDKKVYLFDYFKSGVKLPCFVSLDLSDSKNNPSLKDTKDNYKRLLFHIEQLFGSYSKNHVFYSYGYGAKITDSSKDESTFNLSLKRNDSSLKGIEQIFKSWENLFDQNLIKPENKIILSPLIRKITKEIYKLYEITYYNVSFIIIRGSIDKNDIKDTIDSIIESSYLPLTTFIIGVGKNDYSPMMKIFNGAHKTSSLGMQKMRNNVLFTSLLDDFSNSASELISWCAKELSKQLLSYYDLIKSSPKDIFEKNIKNIKESFNIYNSSIRIIDKINMYESEINQINQKASLLLQGSYSSQNESIKGSQNESHVELDSINPYKKSKNKNSINNSNNSNKSSTNSKTDKKYDNVQEEETDRGETPKYYIPINKESVWNIETKRNPYEKENKDSGTDTGDMQAGPAPCAIQNRKFQIPANSIIDDNQDKKMYNPYAGKFKGKDSENLEGSDYSFGIKKNNNSSGGSEFNSTKNSENIKSSNYFANNNYSIDDFSHLK